MSMSGRIGRAVGLCTFCTLLLAAGCAAPAVTAQTPAAEKTAEAKAYALRINDAHCHYVNFLQETDGMAALLATMDASGVDNVVLFGLPVVKKWDAADPRKPTYYNDNDAKAYYYATTDDIVARAVAALPEGQRARVHPMICGFNPTDRNAVDHVRRMLEWYPGLWAGIGEVLTRHDDLTRMTAEEVSRANHVALDAVYDLAAEKGLPVWVHSNIGTVGLTEPIYLEEMRQAVKAHPKTRFVWCHAGHTRNLKVPAVRAEAERMLADNPNVWIDLSWLVYDVEVAPGGVPDAQWVALIEKYPGRFLIGTDKIGRWATYRKEIRKYEPLLAALKPATAKAVAAENLWKLLPARAAADKR